MSANDRSSNNSGASSSRRSDSNSSNRRGSGSTSRSSSGSASRSSSDGTSRGGSARRSGGEGQGNTSRRGQDGSRSSDNHGSGGSRNSGRPASRPQGSGNSGKPGATGGEKRPDRRDATKGGGEDGGSASRSGSHGSANRAGASRGSGRPASRAGSAATQRGERRSRNAAGAKASGSGARGEKPEGMRLQRMMALAGVASRRTCEIYIQQGRVRVNDRVVTELGTRVQPGVDLVEFDGRTLNINTPRHYYLLYKPVGYLSSVSDPHGARVVTELVPSDERLYPVGRLDLNSEGLLLVTDDGDLTFRLTHPRYEHEKEYLVQVPAALSDEQLAQLQRGVRIHEVGYPARAAGAEQLPETWRWRGEAVPEGHRWLRIVLKEGRKRQIRLMLEALGSEAVRLIRIRMGALTLDDLEPGKGRWLRAREIRDLRRSADLPDIDLS